MFYYGSDEEPIAKLEQRLPIRLAAIVSSISFFSFVDFIICPAPVGECKMDGDGKVGGNFVFEQTEAHSYLVLWVQDILFDPETSGGRVSRHNNTVLPDNQDQSVYMPSSLIPKKNKIELTNLK